MIGRGTRPADGFERVRQALDWWQHCGDDPTSSLTGGGAISALECWLAARFDGHVLALPSGSSAIRTGLRVLGAGPGTTVALPDNGWFGDVGLVRSTGADRHRLTPPEPLVRIQSTTPPVGVPNRTGTWVLVDAADAPPASYHAVARGSWDAIALSFGPGKPVDAGEAGALVLRSPDHWLDAVRLTQHPVRQVLSGVEHVRPDGPFERVHPVAAVTALYLLSECSESEAPLADTR